MTGLISISNLGANIIPMNLSKGGLPMSLGRIARQTMREGRLLVLTGQALGRASVTAPTFYFYKLQVHSILYDIQTNGTNQWQERLLQKVNKTISEGKPVALLSDLIGEQTKDGMELNDRENPVPALPEVSALFKSWHKDSRWQVDRFTFVKVSPPR